MLRKLFEKRSPSKSPSKKSSNSLHSSRESSPTHADTAEDMGKTMLENSRLLCGSIDVENSIETSEKRDDSPNQMPGLLKSEFDIFEEGDVDEQKDSLATNLLEQQQKQRMLSKKLNFDQKCIIMMQDELRATLMENSSLEKKIKTLEDELAEIVALAGEKLGKETEKIEHNILVKIPVLQMKVETMSTISSKKQLSSYLKFCREFRELLKKAEAVAKVKYLQKQTVGTSSTNSTSNAFSSNNSQTGASNNSLKLKNSSNCEKKSNKFFGSLTSCRKKIVAKRHTRNNNKDLNVSQNAFSSNDQRTDSEEMTDMIDEALASNGAEFQNRINMLLNSIKSRNRNSLWDSDVS